MRTKNAARRTSIVDSFQKPALRSKVLVDAIQRRLFFTFPATFRLDFRTKRPHLDVPFIARPRGFRPPVAFRSPRSGERQDSPARSFATEKRRLSFLKLHSRRKRRPENSHRGGCLFLRDRALLFHFWQNKTVLLKRIGTVCVKQHGRTHPAFSHCALNSCERDLKTLRIGREWQEQPELSGACLHGNRQHTDGCDRQRRRVRLKIVWQEFQKEFAISRRHRKPQRPDVKDRFLVA